MFCLLTVFHNNAAEQERYYITIVLKKPQRISLHQFVQPVEQLNSYIMQLSYWFYSPSAKPSTIPVNVNILFAEADLVSHVLCVVRTRPHPVHTCCNDSVNQAASANINSCR